MFRRLCEFGNKGAAGNDASLIKPRKHISVSEFLYVWESDSQKHLTGVHKLCKFRKRAATKTGKVKLPLCVRVARRYLQAMRGAD